MNDDDDYAVKCATLALEGWRPIQTNAGNYGVWNADIKLGFVWHDYLEKLVQHNSWNRDFEEIRWVLLGYRRLAAIEKRLNQS